MWYEVLLPSGILIVLTSMPALICPLINRFTLGNVFNRYTDDPWVEFYFLRDLHLTGNAFKPNGIDTLPDEPLQLQSSKKEEK